MKVFIRKTRLLPLLVLMSLMSAVLGRSESEADVTPRQEARGVCGVRPDDYLDLYGQSRQDSVNEELPEYDEDDLDDYRRDDVPSMSRIVGGSLAVRGKHPWQARVKLLHRNGTVYREHQCGAVIISEHWLLSAAHCFVEFEKFEARVIVGDYSLNVKDYGEQEFVVEKTITHEKYYRPTFDKDIALLKIRPTRKGRGIKFNQFVQPACLPESTTPYTEGTKCLISGWGKVRPEIDQFPIVLQAAEVALIDQTLCKHLYSHSSVTDNMVCAGYVSGGISVCRGDSGGPLVYKNGGAYTLYGITSWGPINCSAPNSPGVFVRVTAFLSWIHSNINLYSENFKQGTLPSKP